MTDRNQGKQDTQQHQASRQNQNIQNQAPQNQAWGQNSAESQYWRNQYEKEPYHQQGRAFNQYESAYMTGTQARSQYAGQRFEDVESDLRGQYEANRGDKSLAWNEGGREACRAAWDRTDQQMSASNRDVQSRREDTGETGRGKGKGN